MTTQASIRAVIDDRRVRATFALLLRLAESPEKLYADIGEHLLISTRQRIQQGISPDGTPFVPLTEPYARRKQEKVGNRPILEYDVHMVGDRFTYAVDDGGLLIGTDAPYAPAQHYGYKPRKLPPRPWLGVSDDDRDAIKRIVGTHLADAIRRSF